MIILLLLPLVIAWNFDEQTDGSIRTTGAVVVDLVVVVVVVRSGTSLERFGGPVQQLLYLEII